LDIQESEEDFDLALVASLETDVVPYLGDVRVPDDLVADLGQILGLGSKVYDTEDPTSALRFSPSTSTSPSSVIPPSRAKDPSNSPSPLLAVESVDINVRYSELGCSHLGKTVSRERFSYWCFDLLFVICSGGRLQDACTSSDE